MSVSGISSNAVCPYTTTALQTKVKQVQQEFQQLGQDLQSGNLSAAQSDFASLQQLDPQIGNSTSNSTPMGQALQQLSQDLQSGNLTAAQQDFSSVQQALQNRSAHGHHGGSSSISQAMSQLGQALQSGNLTSAQQIFASLQQGMQQTGGTSTASVGATNQAVGNTVSVTA